MIAFPFVLISDFNIRYRIRTYTYALRLIELHRHYCECSIWTLTQLYMLTIQNRHSKSIQYLFIVNDIESTQVQSHKQPEPICSLLQFTFIYDKSYDVCRQYSIWWGIIAAKRKTNPKTNDYKNNKTLQTSGFCFCCVWFLAKQKKHTSTIDFFVLQNLTLSVITLDTLKKKSHIALTNKAKMI